MKSREQLDQDETMDEALYKTQIKKMFLGGVVGVLLRNRGPEDKHVCFEIISEDDQYWFPYSGNGASSFWFDDYTQVISDAKQWCEDNCLKDQWGYYFK